MKNLIYIDNQTKETLTLIFYEGTKEELIIDEQNLLLWVNEFNDFEYWIKINVVNKELLKRYLSNDFYLLDLMKDNNLSLYKRYYNEYETFIFETNEVNKIITKDVYLPKEKAVLGYDFYKKFKI